MINEVPLRSVLRTIGQSGGGIGKHALFKKIDFWTDTHVERQLDVLVRRGWVHWWADSMRYTILPEGERALRGEIATPAMVDTLKWLCKHRYGLKEATNISGGTLVELYAERRDATYDLPGHHTAGRTHGWRRAGGTVLARMAEYGLVEPTGIVWGSVHYRMTEAGRKFGDCEGLDE